MTTRILQSLLLMAMTFALFGCATSSTRESLLETRAHGDSAHRTNSYEANLVAINRYLDALNRRDLLALTAYVTPDLEWYSNVKGKRILEVQGREALAQMLKRYFDAHQHTRWTMTAVQGVQDILAIKERSEWNEGDQIQTRESMAIYEMNDGRIRRITYFLQGE